MTMDEKKLKKFMKELLSKYYMDVHIIVITHKHGEDVELYSEEPTQRFLNKIKRRFDTEGNDDCDVRYYGSVCINDIKEMVYDPYSK